MPNIKLIFQYDGTDFFGYELQPKKRTVRGELEKALHKLFNQKIKVTSSSRTDSGVHALGNVVNFSVKTKIPLSKIPKALNSLLPGDLRIIKAQRVKKSFNARYDAKKKTYEYLIYNGEILPPALKNIVWHVKPKLNLTKMKKKAKTLVGTRDFSAYCAAGGDDSNFIRTLYKISVRKRFIKIWDGLRFEVWSLKFTGSGFLYKMVRLMVGALVEASLAKKPRRSCAPAKGLALLRVDY